MIMQPSVQHVTILAPIKPYSILGNNKKQKRHIDLKKIHFSAEWYPNHGRVLDQIWPTDEIKTEWKKAGRPAFNKMLLELTICGVDFSDSNYKGFNFILTNGARSKIRSLS